MDSGQTVRVSGAKLHYIRKGSGTPVVMIHGSYSSHHAYRMSIFDKVAEKYDAIAFDLPGFGKSPRHRKRFPIKDRAALIREALIALKIEKPVLVGHSSGGALALRFALDYPGTASSLVLLAPYVEPYGKSHIFYRAVTAPVIGDLFYFGFLKPWKMFKPDRLFLRRSFSPSEPNVEYAKVEVKLAARRVSFRSSAMDVQNMGFELAEMAGRFGEIKIPVTIIAGDSDVVAPYERNAKQLHPQIPHSKLITLKGIGHTPMFTRPEEVLKAIAGHADNIEHAKRS